SLGGPGCADLHHGQGESSRAGYIAADCLGPTGINPLADRGRAIHSVGTPTISKVRVDQPGYGSGTADSWKLLTSADRRRLLIGIILLAPRLVGVALAQA